MIQNITKGNHFGGLARYVHNKAGAERIAGNMAGRTPAEMEREWSVYREMNSRVEKDVAHISLSLADGERISAEKWEEVATSYVAEMGFENSAWVAYRHQDTTHDHIHIIAHRVSFDGKAVDMWKDYARGEEVCRRLEEQHDLHRVRPSREADRAAPTRAEAEMFKRTGEISVKLDMQARVEAAARATDTMSDYAKALEAEGVSMQLRRRQDGQPYGVIYVRDDGEQMKGSDLGRAFNWGGLQRRAGISYEYERDDAQLRQSEQRAAEAIKHAKGGAERDKPAPEHAGRAKEPERADHSAPERAERVSGRAQDERPALAQQRDSGPQQAARGDIGETESGRRVIHRRAGIEGRHAERGARELDAGAEQGARTPSANRVITRERNSQDDSARSQNHRGSAEGNAQRRAYSAQRANFEPSISHTEGGSGRRPDSPHDVSNRWSKRISTPEKARPNPSDSQRRGDLSFASGRGDLRPLPHMDRGGERAMEQPETDRGKQRKVERERQKDPTEKEIEDKFQMPAEFVPEWFERPEISADTQRELWKEDQITQRLANGQDYEKGRLAGTVVEMHTAGDKTAVVIEAGGRFAVAEVAAEQAQDLKLGDQVRARASELTKTKAREQSRELER